MKWVVIIAAGIASQAAAAETSAYDCMLGEIYSIRADSEGKDVVNPIQFRGGLGDKAWGFSLIQDEETVEISWPESPMQFSGKSPLIQTSEDSYASFRVGRGPCLFTEGHCGTLLQFAKQSDGRLKIQLQPIALLSFEDGHREPFIAYINGTCEAKDGDQ
ncbi:hypothetical protein AEB_P2143 [Altererythrobacter sp. B11]|uniref:hypothetical protein n=1 Tax=Altererythrobacter sp. B11 TaxID=2060312 RepID=UPI000DC715D7|nr:hypothetical protein [Altererythrobacter sp. B11]BBC73011.1 hypothetical protein AEB_P2143 [Altererythrobacter sp. B11]